MADEDGLSNSKPVEHCEVVTCSRIDVVAIRGLARTPKSPPRDSDHMKAIVELIGKLIEDVRVVSQAGEENHCGPSATPIEDFQTDARFHGDEPDPVFRNVASARFRRRRPDGVGGPGRGVRLVGECCRDSVGFAIERSHDTTEQKAKDNGGCRRPYAPHELPGAESANASAGCLG